MPEFDVLMTDDDARRFLRTVLRFGMHLVPDMFYESRAYAEVRDAAELDQLNANLVSMNASYSGYYPELQRNWLLTCSAWTVEPLDMCEVDHFSLGRRYTVSSLFGGPAIMFSFTSEKRVGAETFTGMGHISYRRSYWTLGLRKQMAIPDTLAQFHARLVAEAKSGGKRLKIRETGYWAASDATLAIEAGRKQPHPLMHVPSSPT